MHADRRIARGAEQTHDGAFLGQAGLGREVGEAEDQLVGRQLGIAQFDREATLAGGRHEHPGVEGPPFVPATEPVEAGLRKHQRVEVAVGEAPETCVDVAADVTHVEVRSQSEQRGAAAKARRSHHRALPKVVEGVGAAEGVASVGALQDPRSQETLGKVRRDVLGGVQGHVDLAREEGLLDLLDEARLVGELGRAAAALIARRRDRDDLDLVRQPLGHQAGLCQGQRASARA